MRDLLTKSDFKLFREAPLHLWAKVHCCLESQPLSAEQMHRRQEGQAVEALAYDYLETVLMPQLPGSEMIWQGTYADAGFTIRTDALIFNPGTQTWDLYEVKSSTSVKKDHLEGVCFQTLILERHLTLSSVYILHVNKDYTHGNHATLADFFIRHDVTTAIEPLRESLQECRAEMLAVADLATPPATMACLKPSACPCLSLCHPDLPERSIYEIPRIDKKARELREAGLLAITDIPDDFSLTEIQQKYVQLVINGQPIIQAEAIEKWLDGLTFPLYFLDYETFNPAQPIFPGYHPFDHIIFQFSLHILDRPDDEPRHAACLLVEREDPSDKLVRALLQDLGPTGSVIVWHKSAEAGWNTSLAKRCPRFAEQLVGINARLADLKEIFSKGYYQHPDFYGSSSLKTVLPVICPNLRYDDLAIQEGMQTSLTWAALYHGTIEPDAREKVMADMLAYCQRDTFALVAIWKLLQNLIQ